MGRANFAFARDLSEAVDQEGAYSAQIINAWTSEDLDVVPDPKNLSVVRAEQLALALRIDPDNLIHQIRTIGDEGDLEIERGEEEINTVLDEIQFILRRQNQLHDKLRLLMSQASNAPQSVVKIASFLNGLIQARDMSYLTPAHLARFAFGPDGGVVDEKQWDEADVAPHTGRLWLIFAAQLTEDINELDCARIAVCAQYFTNLNYSPLDINEIAQGASPDSLKLERLRDHRERCSRK